MHIVSYIIAFLATWLISSMILAGLEGIFITTLPLSIVVSTISWMVGEIVYLSTKISNKKNKK